MKKPQHIAEARAIAGDSFELMHYGQLRKNASVARQVEALKRDQAWQKMHQEEVSERIDELIRSIERIEIAGSAQYSHSVLACG